MTECAIAPIILTPQPPHVFQRRSSIRRGTIASISKDVRVNDIVEIIKKQKALTQQERGVGEESLLKRRHSMMNMNRSIKQNNNKRELRTRTLSISDLKGTAAWQQQQQQQQDATTDKIRLGKEIEEKQKKQQQQIVLYQHLRKCAACKSNEMCFSSEPEEEEEVEVNHNSPSSSSSSSSSTDQDTFQWQSSTLHNVEQREQILKNLNSSITDYTNTLKNLTQHPSDSNEYNLQIEKCKSLVQQQQLLLDQLLPSSTNCSSTKASSINTTSFDIVPKTAPTPPIEKNSILSIYNALYKGFKSTTTGITIKQTKDKNELDTIISVQGVCTTIESSLIPDRLLASKATDDITTFNQSGVYQHKYSLEITHQDRQSKFKLLEKDEWQKDENVNVCSFKNCNQPFNWFQRKHHCRGCGQIYCNTHSGNRLPLFSAKETHHPVFSRVCDKCFYQLTTDSLY